MRLWRIGRGAHADLVESHFDRDRIDYSVCHGDGRRRLHVVEVQRPDPDAGCSSRGRRGTPVRGRQGQHGLHGGGGQAHQGYRVLGCRRSEALPRKLPQSRQAGSRILRRRAGPDRAFEIRLLAGATEPEIRAPLALRVSRPAAIDHRLLRVSTGTAAKVTACPG